VSGGDQAAIVLGHRSAAIVAVKTGHTIVCLAMSAAVLYVVVSGVSGTPGPLLLPAIALVLMEGICYVAGRMRCPLTTLARSLGDATGNDYLSDLIVPPRLIRHVVPTCGTLFAVGVLLVGLTALRSAG
jgi:hypothetical protein